MLLKHGLAGLTHKAAAGGGTTYTEEWSSLVNGDTWTQIQGSSDLPWTSRSSTGISVDASTNANAPQGIAVRTNVTVGTDRYLVGLDTELGAAWTTVTVEMELELTDSGNNTFCMFGTATGEPSGIKIHDDGTDLSWYMLANQGWDDLTDPITGFQNVAYGRYGFKYVISGDNMDFYVWTLPGSAPGTPTNSKTNNVDTSDILFPDFCFFDQNMIAGPLVETYSVTIV